MGSLCTRRSGQTTAFKAGDKGIQDPEHGGPQSAIVQDVDGGMVVPSPLGSIASPKDVERLSDDARTTSEQATKNVLPAMPIGTDTIDQKKDKEDQPALRFAVGARVEVNCGGWLSGTVVALWWRDNAWPLGKSVPYQVKVDSGPTVFSPMDSQRCIRAVEGLLAVGQIPVTILTGFLGAGKTTLLNYILSAQHGKKYAVIENEFGEVPIDNQLLDQAVGKLETVESISVLDNGCLCCTVRDDLVRALSEIIFKVDKRYKSGGHLIDGILIETTGMADPGPIVNIFAKNPTIQKYCKIDGILTVVDCKHFLTQLHRERPEDTVNEPAQQIAFADKLLLNKIDACTPALVSETRGAIRGINAYVPIKECTLSKQPDEVPLGELLAIDAFDSAKLLTEQNTTKEVNLVVTEEEPVGDDGGHGMGHGGHGASHSEGHGGGHGGDHDESQGHGHGHAALAARHDTDISSMVLEKHDKALNMPKFQVFLATILQERAVDLYRYKGVLHVMQKGTPSLFILQGVHDMPEVNYSGKWPEGKPVKTQVVIIGRKLERERYRNMFEKCFDSLYE